MIRSSNLGTADSDKRVQQHKKENKGKERTKQIIGFNTYYS